MTTLLRNAAANTELKHLAKTLRGRDKPLSRRVASLARIMRFTIGWIASAWSSAAGRA
jgi:hypothetical protein